MLTRRDLVPFLVGGALVCREAKAAPVRRQQTVWLRMETRGLYGVPETVAVYATRHAAETMLALEGGWKRHDERWLKLFPDERYSRWVSFEERPVLREELP